MNLIGHNAKHNTTQFFDHCLSRVYIFTALNDFVTCFLKATVNILASDDGHGVISFNTSEHFLLREPTSLSGLSGSLATLFVVRHPEEGTFGTVTVQFTVTDANGSLAEGDVIPPQGFVVLEDGVRFKVRKNIYSYDSYMLFNIHMANTC